MTTTKTTTGATETVTCSKCEGRGTYRHFGVCFQCGGSGKFEVDMAAVEATRMPRAQVIARISKCLADMKKEIEWFGCLDTGASLDHYMGQLLAHADADVRDRARAACAGLGLTAACFRAIDGSEATRRAELACGSAVRVAAVRKVA